MFSKVTRAVLWTCAMAAVSVAQSQPAFRSNVDIVVVPLTVVDATGAAVSGLTRDEFQVYDNHVRRPIENLWVDQDQPLILGVILDASDSQREQLAEHRRTAIELLERILRPGDRAFVISVDENVRLWADLTTSLADLRREMAEDPSEPFGHPCARQNLGLAGAQSISACGSSPLWNAVYDAASLKLRPLSGNKALLILTDGFDSGSTHGWQQAAAAAIDADANVYAIQYQSAFGRNFAPDLYRLIAEAGGSSFRAPAGDYTAIVSRMDTDLRQRYVLGFRPEPMSGKVRHDIRVDVRRSDLTVRARKTYYEQGR